MPVVDSINIKCEISNTSNKQKFRTDFPLKTACITTTDDDTASRLEFFGLRRGRNRKDGDPHYFFCKCSTNMDVYRNANDRNKQTISGRAKDEDGNWTDNFKVQDPSAMLTILKIETEQGNISYKLKNILAPSGVEYIKRDNPFAVGEDSRLTPDSDKFMSLDDGTEHEELPFN